LNEDSLAVGSRLLWEKAVKWIVLKSDHKKRGAGCFMGAYALIGEKQLSAMQLSAIKNCYNGSRDDLEAKLAEMELDTSHAKADALLKTMGIGKNDSVFYSGCDGDIQNLEDEKYEAVVGAFFSGAWLSDRI